MRTPLLDPPAEPTTSSARRVARGQPARSGPAGRPARPAGREASRAVYWRRRAVALGVLLAVAFLATGLVGGIGAEAELDDPIAGHEVVEPGQTLWDVAVATAPEGVDARQQLADLRELNGLGTGPVEPWTVVLIPAR